MGRGFDFAVVGVIYTIAVVVHLMGVELMAPGSPLYEVAAGATHMKGQERADLWYEIIAVWVPLMAIGGISAWAFIREYRRQATTAIRGARV